MSAEVIRLGESSQITVETEAVSVLVLVSLVPAPPGSGSQLWVEMGLVAAVQSVRAGGPPGGASGGPAARSGPAPSCCSAG